MANLKALRNRIKSVKSTQKITKAMKMVAASKLRRAQERAQAARPYAEKMERVLVTLAKGIESPDNAPKLLVGNGSDKRHLLVVMTSDRGLCGGFNTTVCRGVRLEIERLKAAGKEVKLIVVGKKGYDQLKGLYSKYIVHRIQDIAKAPVTYVEASQVGDKVLSMYDAGEFDVCTVVYNKFLSAISQQVTFQQLIPLDVKSIKVDEKASGLAGGATYDYEPSEEAVLADLLPRNISVQILKSLLESAASEQGARMTAMDNATRNAGEMIKKLTLEYNRSRQAAITKELIEIISGAEAV